MSRELGKAFNSEGQPNRAEMQQPGSLKMHWEQILAAIQGAIDLVRDLDDYYEAATWIFTLTQLPPF